MEDDGPPDDMRHLELVGPKTDDRVLAPVYDGCNRTCHTSYWAWKAKPGFEKVNQELGRLITTNTIPRYKGIESAKGLGKRKVPFCVALDEGALAQGIQMSNELQKPKGSKDCFLLLNLAAQHILGVVKYQRREWCFLEEYGRWIKLYGTRKSQRHCICMSEGFGLMDDRQIQFGQPDKDGIRRGKLFSGPDFIPNMVNINIEEVPDDDDVDDGRFRADPPEMVAAMYAGKLSDPNPGPSYTGGMAVFVAEIAGEACLGIGTRARRLESMRPE